MTIIQVGPYPLAADCIRGGVESSVFGLTQELVRQGHVVDVFDLPRVGGKDMVERDANLTVHRYANPGGHNKDAMTRAQTMVRDIVALHPDVVHVHGTGELSAMIYNAVKAHGISVMLTIHGLARVEKRNMIAQAWHHHEWKRLAKLMMQYVRQNRVECQLLESADWAIVDTEYLVDALKFYPVKRLPQLFVIPQGTNERYFSVEQLAKNEEQRILCVGTFSQRKSQVELIKAFELVRAKGITAKLVLCGVVSEQLYYSKVQAAIAASPYKADIILRENLSQDELLDEYSRATIFALHSQEESQGIVLVEAMACGLPVVSTKVGGIPYVVEHGKSGLLTEYGDITATAQAIEQLLTDDALRNAYAHNAQLAAEPYRWSSITNRICSLYKN